jgi:hypothetical protein
MGGATWAFTPEWRYPSPPATQGDVTAIKEVLDRIDGKSLAGAPDADEGRG